MNGTFDQKTSLSQVIDLRGDGSELEIDHAILPAALSDVRTRA